MDTNNVSHIFKNIYISNYNMASDINTIKQHKIGAVLYLGSKKKPLYVIKNYENNNISYKFIKITDGNEADLTNCFIQVWDFIRSQSVDTNIIVHCRHGISRAPSVVAYYLMRIMHEYMIHHDEKYPILDDILTLIYMRRPCVKPNDGFVKQLNDYEKKKINIHSQKKC